MNFFQSHLVEWYVAPGNQEEKKRDGVIRSTGIWKRKKMKNEESVMYPKIPKIWDLSNENGDSAGLQVDVWVGLLPRVGSLLYVLPPSLDSDEYSSTLMTLYWGGWWTCQMPIWAISLHSGNFTNVMITIYSLFQPRLHHCSVKSTVLHTTSLPTFFS